MSVELYLIRHADAAPVGEGGVVDDEARPLTTKGEEQGRRLGSGFRAKGTQAEKAARQAISTLF